MSGESSILVQRVLRELRPEFSAAGALPGGRLQAVAVVISDPAGKVADRRDELDGPRPTPWMQRMRSGGSRSRVSVSRLSGQVYYDGRPCCADHLSRYDGNLDQPYPIPVHCPTCGAHYEIQLKFVRPGEM